MSLTLVTPRVMSSWKTVDFNTDKNVFPGDKINADTTQGSFSIYLPGAAQGRTAVGAQSEIIIKDPNVNNWSGSSGYQGWATNNLTIVTNDGARINGLLENLICDVQGASLHLQYWNVVVGWRIYAYR